MLHTHTIAPLSLWALFLSITIVGCASHDLAPVSDIAPQARWFAGEHVVKRNETLYAIAWRYGRDFRELAKINGILSPYTIYPGQVISLSKKGMPTTKIANKNAAKLDNNYLKSKGKHVLAMTNRSQHGAVIPADWVWPAKGKIISRFNHNSGKKTSTNKGIDISGVHGQGVFATRSGDIVYCGSGLRGYGQLIIIKHDNRYLSAYAHNSKLIVKEGDRVKVGQKIAEMGRSGANQVKLHFEIRQEGSPVDPLLFLTKG